MFKVYFQSGEQPPTVARLISAVCIGNGAPRALRRPQLRDPVVFGGPHSSHNGGPRTMNLHNNAHRALRSLWRLGLLINTSSRLIYRGAKRAAGAAMAVSLRAIIYALCKQ
jgi:hypothetical protein